MGGGFFRDGFAVADTPGRVLLAQARIEPGVAIARMLAILTETVRRTATAPPGAIRAAPRMMPRATTQGVMWMTLIEMTPIRGSIGGQSSAASSQTGSRRFGDRSVPRPSTDAVQMGIERI